MPHSQFPYVSSFLNSIFSLGNCFVCCLSTPPPFFLCTSPGDSVSLCFTFFLAHSFTDSYSQRSVYLPCICEWQLVQWPKPKKEFMITLTDRSRLEETEELTYKGSPKIDIEKTRNIPESLKTLYTIRTKLHDLSPRNELLTILQSSLNERTPTVQIQDKTSTPVPWKIYPPLLLHSFSQRTHPILLGS